ncbi:MULTISPECIES: hypothetical protein [Streptomyces]|uniref:Uncharacterized protein n=1 Tax=Streptomyces edwardsiae TaxID=3075527 RepID=A0ABU2PS81_9ACTN|nr:MULTISPECIES: hypothetical protein [unclassified Streptomyces]MDT0394666.1 hypothetical protein [Streptomyces sp. DSM 41636]MDT0402417.1 hypothetical protein [Streptomyces sp. DSM 41635]
MVIFVVASTGREDRLVAGGHGKGGLDEPHAARNSQDASSQGSESEAWIDGKEGSITVR